MKVFSSDILPKLTEAEQEMLEYYLLSGTYGTHKQSIESRMNKLAAQTGSTSKLRYIMSRIFPDMEFYKENYPFFYRHKLLLPIGWIYRVFKGVFVNGKRLFSEFKIVCSKK